MFGTQILLLFFALNVWSTLPSVATKRVPEGGIQPQVAVADDGTVSLVFFKGDPAAGDLFYACSTDGIKFSTPIRVNSVAGTAVALGNIRGARIAVGRQGSVYVVWNGSRRAAPTNGGRIPLLYTRLNRSHSAFEPARNLIHSAYGIDGGAGIASDQAGRVFVFWHAPLPGTQGEASRRVWMTRSLDGGRTFEPERITWTEATGACGCCSLNAFADRTGRLFVLFRSARMTVHRDMYLLSSQDHGNTFTGSDISPWNVSYCVMSTEAFATGPHETLAAWESDKQIHLAPVGERRTKLKESVIGTSQDEKYPSLAQNRGGFTLVSWTQGMGWKRGGSLHWQMFGRSRQPVGTPGAVEGVPAWSLVASYARRDGNFVILY